MFKDAGDDVYRSSYFSVCMFVHAYLRNCMTYFDNFFINLDIVRTLKGLSKLVSRFLKNELLRINFRNYGSDFDNSFLRRLHC